MLSFAEAIALVRQRLNASSGRAAAVVREALKSGELRIIRDDHIDPISGSLFAIVEQDFLDWLNRQVSTTATTPLAARKQPDRERAIPSGGASPYRRCNRLLLHNPRPL
jgi:hypothetical protein